MRRGYRNLPIKRKLQLLIMFTVAAALALACTAILVYDQYSSAREMQRDLGILAEIFASNSTAALTFRDVNAASEILSGLKAKPDVIKAVFYEADGTPLAAYTRKDTRATSVPPMRSDAVWFELSRLKLYRTILLDGQAIGGVYIESDLGELHARLRSFRWILLAILMATFFVAYALSSRLQRIVWSRSRTSRPRPKSFPWIRIIRFAP